MTTQPLADAWAGIQQDLALQRFRATSLARMAEPFNVEAIRSQVFVTQGSHDQAVWPKRKHKKCRAYLLLSCLCWPGTIA
jgi:hypothetical protein